MTLVNHLHQPSGADSGSRGALLIVNDIGVNLQGQCAGAANGYGRIAIAGDSRILRGAFKIIF